MSSSIVLSSSLVFVLFGSSWVEGQGREEQKGGEMEMQKSGLEAIGAVVARDFGEHGVFVGTVISVAKDDMGGYLYEVKYSDGDVEDMDCEEYNYAYAYNLRREGWIVDGEEHDMTALVEIDEHGGGDSDSDFDDGSALKGKKACNSFERGGGEVLESFSRGRESLSPYEKLRQKNVDRNDRFLKNVGLGSNNDRHKKRERPKESPHQRLQRRKVWTSMYFL